MKIKITLLLISLALLFHSCTVNYGFTGASIDYENIKTIKITNFYSRIASGPADLPLRFTEDLKEFIQQRTKLEVTNKQSDVQVEGYVSYYDVTPLGGSVNANGQEFAALNKLTIRINVKYTNTKDPSQSYEQSFTSPNDLTFEQSQNLSDVEDDLIDVAFDQIKLDIYNRCFSNW
ncbi:MAG: LPS assembly lipoprotein LptE [Cyclobacteriaceae bacterium]